MHSMSRRRTPMPPIAETATYYDLLHRTVHHCNTPYRAETAHAIIANSQSRSKTQEQTHKTANTLQTLQRKTRECLIRQNSRDLFSSDAPLEPDPACTLQRHAQVNSCKAAAKTAIRQIHRSSVGTLLQPIT